MELRVLGPVQVLDGGVSLPLGGSKQRAVLVMLALHANRVVSTGALIEGLWGGRAPGQRAERAAVLRVPAAEGPQPA